MQSKDSSAWTEVWSGIWPSRASLTTPGIAFWTIFEILGGAGDIYNLIIMTTYSGGSYVHLG